MAHRKRRAILTGLGLVLVLLVLVLVLIPALIPQERLRALAVDRVHAMTGGDVVLGQVSVKVLPRLRLVLGDSRLTMTGQGMRGAGLQPGVLDSARVGIDRLELDLALWPLLRKKLEFGKIRLIGPDVLVVTHPAATDSTAAAAARSRDGQASPWGLALAGVEVRDGHLVWRETGTARGVEVGGWKQELSGSNIGAVAARAQRLAGLPPAAGQAGTDGSGDAKLGIHATVERILLTGLSPRPLPPVTDAVLEAELVIPPAADRATFVVSELSIPGFKVVLSGHANRERLTVTDLDLTGADGAIDLSGSFGVATPPAAGRLRGALAGRIDVAGAMRALEPYLPPPAPGAAPRPEITGNATVAVVAGAAQAPPLNRGDLWAQALKSGALDTLLVTAESSDLAVAAPQLGEPLRPARLEYRGDLLSAGLGHHLVARGLTHPILQGDVTVDFGLAAAGAPHQVRAALGKVDLDALTAIMQRQQPAGADAQTSRGWSLVAAAYAAPPPRPAGEMIPADLQVAFAASADEVLLLAMPYRRVQVQGDLTNRVVTVSQLQAQLGDGTVKGDARVDYATDPQGVASFAFQATQVPAGVLLEPYTPFLAKLWEGQLNATGKGRCRLGDQAVIRQSLSLDGSLAATDGRIDLTSLLADIKPYLGARQDLTRVTYSRYTQGLRIDDGKVRISDLVIDGRDTDWTGGGWLGFDGTLDLTVKVKLPPNYVPNLGDLAWVADALKDPQGRIDLGFHLTGQQTRPDVALDIDTSRLKQNASEQVKEKVREGLGGLLDKLKRK